MRRLLRRLRDKALDKLIAALSARLAEHKRASDQTERAAHQAVAQLVAESQPPVEPIDEALSTLYQIAFIAGWDASAAQHMHQHGVTAHGAARSFRAALERTQ